MCRTHKIARQLDVQILKHLKGSEQLDVPDSSLEDGSYLVEKEGEKFVLKTGNFTENEVDDNWALADMGIPVRQITEAERDNYILYEYVDAPVLSSQQFWDDNNMKKVFDLHGRIAEALAGKLIPEDMEEVRQWIYDKPVQTWLRPLEGNVYTTDQVTHLENLIGKWVDKVTVSEDGLQRIYKDTNGDHYINSEAGLVVVDADIQVRPKYYMDMRYLAWVILKMPSQDLSLDWVKDWVITLGKNPRRLLTFLLSLIGILWDIHSNEKHKGEHIEKTDKIKEIVDWVVKELGGKNE